LVGNAGELPWKAEAGELPWKAGEFPDKLLSEKSGKPWLDDGVRFGNVCEEDMEGSKVCEEGVKSVLGENMEEEAGFGNGLASWNGEDWDVKVMPGA